MHFSTRDARGETAVVTATKSQPHKNLEKKRRILVVEDERDISDLLVFNLERAGYQVEARFDGRSALERIISNPPDLIVLDLMLPELSGSEVATRVRNSPTTATVPIIMLTAKADEVDQLVGLTMGADDYVTKPFSVKVLLARIEAILRRTPSGDSTRESGELRAAGIRVNTQTHEVTYQDQPVHLTLTEFKILAALLGAAGKVLSRQHLMTRAMGQGITVTERTIDVHVTAIRKKLGEGGAFVRTVRGVGYRVTEKRDANDE
jgi:two-component system phosphate regulon response regulator PhoB